MQSGSEKWVYFFSHLFRIYVSLYCWVLPFVCVLVSGSLSPSKHFLSFVKCSCAASFNTLFTHMIFFMYHPIIVARLYILVCFFWAFPLFYRSLHFLRCLDCILLIHLHFYSPFIVFNHMFPLIFIISKSYIHDHCCIPYPVSDPWINILPATGILIFVGIVEEFLKVCQCLLISDSLLYNFIINCNMIYFFQG